MFVYRAHKGHLRERTRQARADKITKAMNEMPSKLEKYQQELDAKKTPVGILNVIKRLDDRARKY